MTPPRVFVVAGVCVPERRSYARHLAAFADADLLAAGFPEPRRPPQRGHRPLVAASRRQSTTAPRPRPVDADRFVAAATRRTLDSVRPVVVDLPTDVTLPHMLGALGDDTVQTVCIVDATHAIDDLRHHGALRPGAPGGDPRGDAGSRALHAAQSMEFATTIVVAGWDGLSTPDLSRLMALLTHMGPSARLRLSRTVADDLAGTHPHTATHGRPGWVHVLNGEFDPHMTDPHVGAMRYEQVRPFHPARLRTLLDDLAAGRFGELLRSSGFCRFATRPGTSALWEQVGGAAWFTPIATDAGDLATVGQDLAMIGLDLAAAPLRQALDAACLTDRELTDGPRVWARYDDPFPRWLPG